ncbi:hypothetical protein ACHAQA_007801 [Verticillium albo-atrum]
MRGGSILGLFVRPLNRIRGPQHAAYAAALGLVAIQVGIGIVMKASQTGGSYLFSPSASVTISEFFKMLLSAVFFYRECEDRAKRGIGPSNRGIASGFMSLREPELPTTEKQGQNSSEEEPTASASNGYVQSNGSSKIKNKSAPSAELNLSSYWDYVQGEVTKDVQYGFCRLALFYVLINNLIFVSYKMADPGTIQLTKSGVTFITALVMIATLNTKVSRIQWIAIVLQICGLMVTQYSPETGTTYSFSTYAILLFQVFLSASSGVYNQALLKTDESSLHADNMILYAAGAVINLLCHVVIRSFKADEPGFFEGYNSFGAFMVIVSNVFIGLAITAVYKYADAVIKCFATAFATGVLLYISPVLFATELSFLVLPGTIVVFAASWLYMDNPPPKSVSLIEDDEPQKLTFFGKLAAVSMKFNAAFLSMATIFTVMTVAFLSIVGSRIPLVAEDKIPSTNPPSNLINVDNHENGTIVSPFKNTLAMIRWNSAHPERIPLLMKYAPFFHTIHISMPKLLEDESPDFHNITHDQSPGTRVIFNQVARTMKLILDTEPEIDGLLYYHFDAWIDPMAWSGMDRYSIWYPHIIDEAPPSHGGPKFVCMTKTQKYNWWGWEQDFHRKAVAAANVVNGFGMHYKIKENEFCVGWSDIYYIPRRFFADYIFLSEVFGGFDVFHEVAIPTMLHIIDQSRRRNPYKPVMERIGDCWGSCCASNPTVEDVLEARCGHRLDYLTEAPVDAFYGKLDEQAKLLGQPMPETKYAMSSSDAADKFESAILTVLNSGNPKDVLPIEDDELHDDERADKELAEWNRAEAAKLEAEKAPVGPTEGKEKPKDDGKDRKTEETADSDPKSERRWLGREVGAGAIAGLGY